MKRPFFSPWFLIFILFGIVIWRLVALQLFPDARVESQSRRQYWSRIPVSTNRGLIYDRNGNALAVSVPSSSFFIDPAFWDPKEAHRLNGILPSNTVQNISKQLSGRFVWVVRKVDEDTAARYAHLAWKVFLRWRKKRDSIQGVHSWLMCLGSAILTTEGSPAWS